MRFYMFAILTFTFSHNFSQYDSTNYSIKYANREIESTLLDTLKIADKWISTQHSYSNGQIQSEERVFISKGCFSNQFNVKCNCFYQKQIFYQNEDHVLMMKEGKYVKQRNGKQIFKHYEYWYNEEGKLMNKSKVSSSERMKF